MTIDVLFFSGKKWLKYSLFIANKVETKGKKRGRPKDRNESNFWFLVATTIVREQAKRTRTRLEQDIADT